MSQPNKVTHTAPVKMNLSSYVHEWIFYDLVYYVVAPLRTMPLENVTVLDVWCSGEGKVYTSLNDVVNSFSFTSGLTLMRIKGNSIGFVHSLAQDMSFRDETVSSSITVKYSVFTPEGWLDCVSTVRSGETDGSETTRPDDGEPEPEPEPYRVIPGCNSGLFGNGWDSLRVSINGQEIHSVSQATKLIPPEVSRVVRNPNVYDELNTSELKSLLRQKDFLLDEVELRFTRCRENAKALKEKLRQIESIVGRGQTHKPVNQ